MTTLEPIGAGFWFSRNLCCIVNWNEEYLGGGGGGGGGGGVGWIRRVHKMVGKAGMYSGGRFCFTIPPTYPNVIVPRSIQQSLLQLLPNSSLPPKLLNCCLCLFQLFKRKQRLEIKME